MKPDPDRKAEIDRAEEDSPAAGTIAAAVTEEVTEEVAEAAEAEAGQTEGEVTGKNFPGLMIK